MEFVNKVTPTLLSEPRIEVSINDYQINEIVEFPSFNCFDFYESGDDDLVLFGVGGPA